MLARSLLKDAGRLRVGIKSCETGGGADSERGKLAQRFNRTRSPASKAVSVNCLARSAGVLIEIVPGGVALSNAPANAARGSKRDFSCRASATVEGTIA